jgi:hypothetical protein
MASPASITKHPIHPMLVALPIGLWINDMGKPENITNKTFEAAAAVMGQSAKDARANAHKLLEKVLASKEDSQDKNWKP